MKKKVNLKKLENEAFQRAANAQKTSDTYPAINYILDQLGDDHSFFIEPPTSEDEVKEEKKRQTSFDLTKGELLHHKIGYIVLPNFSGQEEEAIKYALHVSTLIKNLAKHNPCGWVIDLRQNRGGNMWPMLAGIAPLVGEGKLGAFIDSDGKESKWIHRKGDLLIEKDVVFSLPAGALYTIPNTPPIAVLIGPKIASSGEAIAVAFKNRPHTRFFGQKTDGRSTSNVPFPLKDGAELVLTTAVFADRYNNIYEAGVLPDEFTVDETGKEDISLEKAIKWLFDQSECRKSGQGS